MKLNAMRKFFGSEELLEDEETMPRKKNRRGYHVVTGTPSDDMKPGVARSYKVGNIMGEPIEQGSIEEEPGEEFTNLVRFFASEYPDFRDSLIDIVKETGKESDIQEPDYVRVYISAEEDPKELEGLTCVTDPRDVDENSVFVVLKPGEAEIAFPEGYHPWTAEIDADGNPTIIASVKENAKFSKIYAKKLAERKAARQAELNAQSQQQDQPEAKPESEADKAEDADKKAPKKGGKKEE